MLVSRALEQYPDNAQLLLLFAEEQIDAGESSEAVSTVTRILALKLEDIDAYRLATIAERANSPELLDKVLSEYAPIGDDIVKYSNLALRAASMGRMQCGDVLHQAVVEHYISSSSHENVSLEFRQSDMDTAPIVLFAALQHFMDRCNPPRNNFLLLAEDDCNRSPDLRRLIDVTGHALFVLSKSIPPDDFNPEALALTGLFLAQFEEKPTDGLALCEAAIKQFKSLGPGTRQDRELFSSTNTPLATRAGSLANIYLYASLAADLAKKPDCASKYRSLGVEQHNQAEQDWSHFLGDAE